MSDFHPHLRRPALAAAIAASLSLLVCATAGGAVAPAPASALLRGVNIEYSDSAGIGSELSAAKAIHAGAVRVLVRWSQLEPSAPGKLAPGPSAALDELVHTAAANGIKVIMVVDGTPCWISSAPATIERGCVPGQETEANAWAPRDPSQYGAFMGYLAQRYGGQLAALEVWNEPDQSNEKYLAGPNKAENYAAMLRSAYMAIKSVAPQVPVLGGSIVGPRGTFLRALYAAGIKGYYDGLAVHFYTLTLASLRSIHEVQVQNGDTTPLWLDEFGWSSCWPRQRVQQEQGCVTRNVQAADLASITHSLSQMPYVAAEIFYKLRNIPDEQFGVLGEGGEQKPSFGAVARVFATPFGSPAPVRLKLRRSKGAAVASGSGPVGEFMELEAFKRGALRYRTIFTLDRFNDYSIALPSSLGSHHLLVRVLAYGSGARSSARRL